VGGRLATPTPPSPHFARRLDKLLVHLERLVPILGPIYVSVNGQTGNGSGTLRGMSLGVGLTLHVPVTEYMEFVVPSGRVTSFVRVLLVFHPQDSISDM
jgi:hypothetical protein